MQDDLISRQAVLNLFNYPYGWEMSLVKKKIEEIPSVNPLSVFDNIKAKLQRLADDEWNQNVGNYAQGLRDAIEIIDECMEESEETE